ncbi:thioredoxin TrxA [Xanthomonadaceae bacterium JHOS43]|nr:thioredoxin TrxA [Xanthomonadaceae bacterium JHOS43]MCX7564433.1 thioredoxin TrxA [Xanthomonadaceae bacterium XH05]
MSDNVLNVGDADFQDQVLASETPVLVDFWAEWCGPCKMIAPIIDELAESYAGRVKVVKVNVDHARQTAAKFGVRGIPTLLVFKDGEVKASQVGMVGKAQLAQLIDSAV